jgi:ATP-dependent DNA helicase PIF1
MELLNKPFGGIQVIFIGDFCQLAPVNGTYCFLSKLWKDANIKVILLEELVRQNGDNLFQQILQIIRRGRCTDNILKVLRTLKDTRFNDEIIPTKLYPKNVNVDRINELEINKLKMAGNKTHIYNAEASKDKGKNANIAKYDVELVENAQVIVTRNIDISLGIVNGTRGIVKALEEDCVVIKDTQGQLHTIFYYKDVIDTPGKTVATSVTAVTAVTEAKTAKVPKAAKAAKAGAAEKSYISHIPLKVSYALSIHKSQGMTIDAVEIDLGDNIFTCGQAYTALSRAKSLASIKIIDVSKESFKMNPHVKAFYRDNS